jgi:hypothetical protein
MNTPSKTISELPFNLETPLERQVAADADWQVGLEWGKPRAGHPEGRVVLHIREVLANVDRYFQRSEDRPGLRLIALIHDTFKYKAAEVETGAAKKSHGYWAREFAERYLSQTAILEVIELHDEAYKAHVLMTRDGAHEAAEKRALELIHLLGANIDLFLRFYWCDCLTGNKSTEHYEWFKALAGK